MEFYLKSITQRTAAVVRIKYSKIPLCHSELESNDALRLSNYSIIGPTVNSVGLIKFVEGDPYSFDLTFTSQIIAGDWMLTVSNVQTPTGEDLTDADLSFTATAPSTAALVSGGGDSESTEDVIRRWLSPAMVGKVWDALIASVGAADKSLWDNAKYAFDQVFSSSASGKYLTQRASDVGIERPYNAGIPDEIFQDLISSLNSNKNTYNALLKALNVFYGDKYTKANITSTLAETYSLANGDYLDILIDEEYSVRYVLDQDDFDDLTAITALELAVSITKFFQKRGVKAFALEYNDRYNSARYVTIYSETLGLHGSVRIKGGKIQNVLQFPTLLATTQVAGTTWSVTPLNGIATYTFTAGTNPSLQLVHSGDYVNIYGAFASTNQGVFEIKSVTATTFTVSNLAATTQAGVNTAAAGNMRFYRPDRYTVLSNPFPAYAVKNGANSIDVVLPATTPTVIRQYGRAAYLNVNTSTGYNEGALGISAASRAAGGTVTITTSSVHGLATNDWVLIDGLTTNYSGNSSGTLNGIFKVTVTSTTQFTYSQDSFIAVTGIATNGKVIPFKAIAGNTGPYIFDPDNGPAITSISTTTAQALNRGLSYKVITVADSSDFPDEEGYVVIGFGTTNQTVPIKYTGAPIASKLILDDGYVFLNTFASGADITLLKTKEAFVTTNPQTINSFYVTDSPAGRVALEKIIDDIKSEGITLNKIITYPSDIGLGNEFLPISGTDKLSDNVVIYAGDNVDQTVEDAREE